MCQKQQSHLKYANFALNDIGPQPETALRCDTSGLLQHPGDIVKPGMTRSTKQMAQDSPSEAIESSAAKAASSENVDVEVSANLTVIILTCTTSLRL